MGHLLSGKQGADLAKKARALKVVRLGCLSMSVGGGQRVQLKDLEGTSDPDQVH